MNFPLKKLLALLLALVMILGLLPLLSFAEGPEASDKTNPEKVYTDEDSALLDQDVFARIEAVKTEAARRQGGMGRMTRQDYAAIIPEVIEAIQGSETYVAGTLQQNGSLLVWETTVGLPCCYSPRMEAQLHNTVEDPAPDEIARAEAEAEALLDLTATVRGGAPISDKIGLIQPYWESSSSYADSSFRNYSPYYKTMWQNLYGATGGTGMRYSMSSATVDNIGSTLSQCGLVIFDSHGNTDYEGSNGDYTSRANTSYLCLTSSTGVTSADTAAQTGPYGRYYHCLKGSGYAYADGTCLANHMPSNAPHSLLYMGICLGMATDGLEAPLRAKGIEVVWGYSQSVSFEGERKYMESILGYVKSGDRFKDAVSKAKSSLGKWDPAYSSYSLSQAVANHVAFPICVSSEDVYPGHGNVDAVQTVSSTWALFGQNYTVTAAANNSDYGTVSVDGYSITAAPKPGYYAAGYTVVSGVAAVTQSGNVFLVDPSTDCTVRVDFAPKVPASLRYLANGTQIGTDSGYVGDAVTLPAAAPEPEGWTFRGWVESPLEETGEKPAFYGPGDSYVPSDADVTLYALYIRVEETGGGTVYQLAEGVENGGTYILVSEAAVNGSAAYAVGNTAVTGNHYLKAISVSVSEDRCSASTSNLPKVLWKASASGNGYTFYNEAAGKYMGLDSSEFIYPSNSPLAWAYTEEGCLDNQTDSEGYYYLSYDGSNGRYTTSKTGSTILLYKAVNDNVTYYTTGSAPSGPVFNDVADPGLYYYEAVQWAVENGITNGMGDGSFGANLACTRAQVVSFLYRAAGSPAVTGSVSFSDVSASAWYRDAVLWAVQNGISSGTSSDRFSPNQPCTRAQAVTFLYRAAGSPAPGGSVAFADVPAGCWYYDAVCWALANGVTTGTGASAFSPNTVVSRAQTVTFLYRACQ